MFFSYRFQDLFPDPTLVRDSQSELDTIIQMGVFNITKLLKSSESSTSSDVSGEPAQPKSQKYIRGSLIQLHRHFASLYVLLMVSVNPSNWWKFNVFLFEFTGRRPISRRDLSE